MATLSKELPQQGPPAAAVAVEDESLKRNTDCVYFLASPLTCKKGSECEYRHSEVARTNPRDCWYWLNANCLNPKCPFRHPPLDGLVPPQGGNIAGPSFPVPSSGPPVPLVPHNGGKQAVPCIYFQQGYCLKGDRCPFLHGPIHPPNTKIQPNPVTTGATEAPAFKKTFGGLEKFTQPKMSYHSNTPKVVEAARQPQTNAAPKALTSRLMERGPAAKRYPPSVMDETPNYRETAPSGDNGTLRSRAARPRHASLVEDQNHQNGRDVDDSLRESSPGFDVLVDDKVREDDYYHDEDQHARMRSREGRRIDEFDLGHRDDYNSVADVDRDNYRSKRGRDSYDCYREKYNREQRGASSERKAAHDKRGLFKSDGPDLIQNSSDLRHRLSKQRRGNGLRSVVSPDYKPDYLSEERGYRSSRRDTRRSPVRERSTGSRLQGRIKLPRISPPASANMYSERDNERGRNLGRVSPSRPQVSLHQGRLRDRLSIRTQDESNEGRSLRGQMREESTIQGNGTGFIAPKSLSELRGTKGIDNKHQQPIGQQSISGVKLRDTVLAGSLGTEGDIAFDGPKPLSEILKRKRNTGTTASVGAVNFDEKEAKSQNKDDVNLTSRAPDFVSDTAKQVLPSSTPEQTQVDVQENNKSVTAEGDKEEGEISNKKINLIEDESAIPEDEKHPEAEEEGVFGGDGEEEHEADEEYDQGDEEYDYEQDEDPEGYNLNEGEVDEGEVDEEGDAGDNEDFMDEDDGDDFAKKLGVSF